MKQLGLCILIMMSVACKRVTVTLDKLPNNTPKGAQIYVTGDFNNWNPGDPGYVLRLDESTGKYAVDLPYGFGNIEYKFTRGDWTTVETDPCGGDLLNRFLRYIDADVERDTIVGWKDLEPENCSRVVLVINKLPVNTPPNAPIYLGGDINGWQANNERYRFTPISGGGFCLNVPRYSDKLNFKITRGSWENTELNESGTDQMQREILFGKQDTVYLSLNTWSDLPSDGARKQLIIISGLPKGTPVASDLYFTGTVNNWNPMDARSKFVKVNGVYQFSITRSINDEIEYKITRGGWHKVETNLQFQDIANRILSPNADTVRIQIANWMDLATPVQRKRASEINRVRLPQPDQTLSMPVLKPVPANPIDTDRRKKVFIIIDKMPEFSKEDPVYLAGDFNGWMERNESFRFKKLPNGKRYFVLRLEDANEHEFKITRGSWDREEAYLKGEKPANRKIASGPADDTIHVNINYWYDETDQKTLVMLLTKVPEKTYDTDGLYLTGDFNDWNPKDELHRFKPLPDGRYVLTIKDFSKRYQYYKITRGDWDNEAATSSGRAPGNQVFKLNGTDTLRIRVDRWKDR